MRLALFYHSLVSDWNHGNAHFLRGVAAELIARGHDVRIFEPRTGWSRANLVSEHGEAPIGEFRRAFPGLMSREYDLETLDLNEALAGTDVAIVHEWNEPGLVRAIGEHRARARDFVLLFHDTHHRAATDPDAIDRFDLSNYDGVLAYGRVLRDLYIRRGWARRAWTWHEAADTRVFRPAFAEAKDGDVVWIGNWGDEERTAELAEFFIEPAAASGIRARVYGVRYPRQATDRLREAGIEYGGWIPNYRVPEVFARFRATVHIPRRPYVRALPGIPTIRVFEALACGIPLVSAPWNDLEGLFTPGADYLVARDGAEMRSMLEMLLSDHETASRLAAHGLQTILARHTCSHRVDELFRICEDLRDDRTAAEVAA